MPIKAVLLDLDGTIVNTNEIILKTFEYTLNKHLGYCPPTEELIKTFGKPLKEVLESYKPGHMEELLADYQAYQLSLDHEKYVFLCPHVIEALDGFKSMGLKIALVTSKRHENAYMDLNQFHLVPYFDAIVTYEDTTEHKPTAAPAAKALELLEIAPEEAIMAGDSTFDILCGQSAGTKTAVVTYSAYTYEDLMQYHPDYCLADLTALIPILS